MRGAAVSIRNPCPRRRSTTLPAIRWMPIDYCYEQGWTDGLPVVPPEESRVQATLAMEGRLTGDRDRASPRRRDWN